MATPNMNLTLPTVGVTLDPTWATNLNAALTLVDSHNHTSGKGVTVPTAGLNINADLSFGSNDATDLRSLALNNNVSTLPSGDIRALYASGGDLYYNNNSGNAIQLTTGSSLNTGALALNVWELQELAGNLTITSGDSFVFINTNTSTTRTIILPAASAVTAGRYYIIKDKTGSAATNNITITPAGSDTIDGVSASVKVTSAYGNLTLISDGVSGWLTNAAISGFITLGGDLLGTGSTVTAPKVSGLTGIAGLVTMANNTALNTRDVGNSVNVNLVKMNGSDQVVVGDAAYASIVNGDSIVLTGGANGVGVTSSADITLTAATTATVTGSSIVLSGNITEAVAANNVFISGKDTGATSVPLAGVDGTDVVVFSDTSYHTRIEGNNLHLQASTITSPASAVTLSAGSLTLTSGNVTLTDGYLYLGDRQVSNGESITFTDGSSNINQVGSVVKSLTSNASTTSATAQSSNLAFDVKSGEHWSIEIAGAISTQAGNGGYLGLTMPAASTTLQTGFAILATSNYAVDTTAAGGEFLLVDADGISVPFRISANVIAGANGTITLKYRSYTGGDTTNILAGTTLTARRCVGV